MPPIDLSKLPESRSQFQYTRRDVLLYAVSEGASFDDHKCVFPAVHGAIKAGCGIYLRQRRDSDWTSPRLHLGGPSLPFLVIGTSGNVTPTSRLFLPTLLFSARRVGLYVDVDAEWS